MKKVIHLRTGKQVYGSRAQSWAGHVFRNKDLRYANFAEADLHGAIFANCAIDGASFVNANLRDASFYGCVGYFAGFGNADMRGSHIDSSHQWANWNYTAPRRGFFMAEFSNANLTGADLTEAHMADCRFDNARMTDADVGTARLGTRFNQASFNGAKGVPAAIITTAPVMPTGEFKGWKKCEDGKLVELMIPADAKRSSGLSRKVRASHVITVSIKSKHGDGRACKKATSQRSDKFDTCEYITDVVTRADKWDPNRWNICTHGIHFFLTREEAVRHHQSE